MSFLNRTIFDLTLSPQGFVMWYTITVIKSRDHPCIAYLIMIWCFLSCLCKLGICVCVYWKFSRHNVIVRLTKIMSNLGKDSDFQCHFLASKIGPIFPKSFSVKNIWLEHQLIFLNFFENFDFWSTLFYKNVYNFCRLCSKNASFQYMHLWFHAQLEQKILNGFYFRDQEATINI